MIQGEPGLPVCVCVCVCVSQYVCVSVCVSQCVRAHRCLHAVTCGEQKRWLLPVAHVCSRCARRGGFEAGGRSVGSPRVDMAWSSRSTYKITHTSHTHTHTHTHIPMGSKGPISDTCIYMHIQAHALCSHWVIANGLSTCRALSRPLASSVL